MKNFVFLIFAAAILLYIPSSQVYFVNDEIEFISRNEVHNIDELLHLFDKKDYDGYYYRPLGNFISGCLTYFFNYDPLPYRVFNLLLHALNSVLVFYLILFLLNERENKYYIALFAALFFAAFPLNDYAVIWHTDLFDRLTVLFYLTGIIMFLKNNRYLSLVFFLLALLSKEMAFSCPAVVFIIAFFRERENKLRKGIISAAPYAALLIVYILFRLIILNNNVFTAEDAHSGQSLISIIKNIFLFIGLMVFPFFIREIENLILNYTLLFNVISFISAAGITYLLRNKLKDRYILFFILLTLILLAPASRLFMRWYTYLPLAGFTGLISSLIFSFSRKNLKMPIAVCSVLFLIYSTSLIIKEMEWVSVSEKGRVIVSSLIFNYGSDIEKADELIFLTLPAKVNDIPLFHLRFDAHLNHRLQHKKEIKILTGSVLEDITARINYEVKDNGVYLEQSRDNSFLLSRIEKNIKFTIQNSVKGKIKKLFINIPKEPDKILFTFSDSKFIKIEDNK